MLRILSTSAGYELANLGFRGEHVTPRPPRPTSGIKIYKLFLNHSIKYKLAGYFVTVLCIFLKREIIFLTNTFQKDQVQILVIRASNY